MTAADRGCEPSGVDPAVEAELVAQGWKRRFIADEPRLSEAVELYAEIGLEVKLVAVSFTAAACSECMQAEPDRYRVIFTRPTLGG